MCDCGCVDAWSADYDSDPVASSYSTVSYEPSYEPNYEPAQVDYAGAAAFDPVQAEPSVFDVGGGTAVDGPSIFDQAMEPTSYDSGGGVVIDGPGIFGGFDEPSAALASDGGVIIDGPGMLGGFDEPSAALASDGGTVIPYEGSLFSHFDDPSNTNVPNIDHMLQDIGNMPSHPSAGPYVGPTFGPSAATDIQGIADISDNWAQDSTLNFDPYHPGNLVDHNGVSESVNSYTPRYESDGRTSLS